MRMKIIVDSRARCAIEAKDAEVLVHEWETGHRVGRLEHEEHRSLLVRAGVPPDEIETMRRMYEDVRQYADSFETDEYGELRDEAELEFETGTLRVVHTPGHTPGSCSFLREADRTVIAGDCVLKRITPNPVLSPDPDRSVETFRFTGGVSGEPGAAAYVLRPRSCMAAMVSRSMILKNCSIATFARSGNDRRDVIRLLPKTGATAWEIARQMFPAPMMSIAFWQFPKQSHILIWRTPKAKSHWSLAMVGKSIARPARSCRPRTDKEIFHSPFLICHCPQSGHRLESGLVRLAQRGTSALSKRFATPNGMQPTSSSAMKREK